VIFYFHYWTQYRLYIRTFKRNELAKDQDNVLVVYIMYRTISFINPRLYSGVSQKSLPTKIKYI